MSERLKRMLLDTYASKKCQYTDAEWASIMSDPKVRAAWNTATDIVIDNILKDAGVTSPTNEQREFVREHELNHAIWADLYKATQGETK